MHNIYIYIIYIYNIYNIHIHTHVMVDDGGSYIRHPQQSRAFRLQLFGQSFQVFEVLPPRLNRWLPQCQAPNPFNFGAQTNVYKSLHIHIGSKHMRFLRSVLQTKNLLPLHGFESLVGLFMMFMTASDLEHAQFWNLNDQSVSIIVGWPSWDVSFWR